MPRFLVPLFGLLLCAYGTYELIQNSADEVHDAMHAVRHALYEYPDTAQVASSADLAIHMTWTRGNRLGIALVLAGLLLAASPLFNLRRLAQPSAS